MIEDLIRRARRRLIVNEALSQSALACAFLVGGLALILIVGTRYLEWWTLALFALAGLAVGAARIRHAIPSAYSAAAMVDRNAQLKDTLATAFWFEHHDAPFPETSRIQRAQAEAAAQTVDLNIAIPFTLPRSLYVMAGLALLASGLVLFRFAATKNLDLQAPLTEVLFEDLAARPQDKKADLDRAREKNMENAESLLAKLGLLKPEDKKDEAALDKAIEQALEGQTPAEKNDKGAPGKNEGGSPAGLDQTPNGDSLDGKKTENKDQSGDKNEGKPGGEGDNKGAPKDANGDSSSLMSKLKDAVNNMISKPGDKNGDKKDGGKQQAKGDQKGEKGQQSQGKDQNGQQSQAQDGEPSGEAQQDGQQAQGKAGSKSEQQSAQSGSGVGSQDGAKDLKAAEQMKAMGKLSEIIGKRNATVTGETTVEVQSGNQNLRTNYSTKTAAHGQTDSDVSRDEIPVSLQPYVQSYFEQVRKAGQTPKSKPAAAPAATTPPVQ